MWLRTEPLEGENIARKKRKGYRTSLQDSIETDGQQKKRADAAVNQR